MKKNLRIAIVLLLVIALVPVSALAHTAEDPFVTDLIAGGGGKGSSGVAIGNVSVWNDNDNLYIKFETTEPGWVINRTHIAVEESLAAIPQKKGNPNPGKFEFYATYNPAVESPPVYEIDLNDWEVGTDLFIAAHADVSRVAGSIIVQKETAWGNGTKFDGKNWAMFLTYTVQGSEADIVVYNDIDTFGTPCMFNPSNIQMVTNLVSYSTAQPRGSGTVVWFDGGRNSPSYIDVQPGGYVQQTRSTITSAGYSITDISSTSGSITSIPANVKVIFLWLPLVPYTTDEINTLKQFAQEGGRIVFVGEWDGYYGSGIGVENQFLSDMGSVMTNVGGGVDPMFVFIPGTSLRPHQITTGMTNVEVAASSVVVPGPADSPLYYDSSNTMVLAAVTKIDTTPITMPVNAPVSAITYTGGGYTSSGEAL